MVKPAKPQNRFTPARWLRNHHLQTLWPHFTRRGPWPAYSREVVDLPDGDFIDLDWHRKPQNSGKLALLIHGLGGDSRSHYIRGLVNQLGKQGIGVVAMNLRGSGGRPNRRPKTYHSGHTGDIDFIAGYLKQSFPGIRLYAVGFSLGGNALLKWLGEHPATAPLHKAVAVSVPFDLDNAAERLERGFSRIYQRKLLWGLQKGLGKHHGLLKGRYDRHSAFNARGFRTFDEAVTAKVNGFKNYEDYYTTSSSGQYLGKVRTPTLILHSRDDPFMSHTAIPVTSNVSPKIQLELTSHGGHVGFVSRKTGANDRYWLERRISNYICGDGAD